MDNSLTGLKLDENDVREYQRVYGIFATDFNIIASSEHIGLVLQDIYFPPIADEDRMHIFTNERVYGGHGYLSLTIVNDTAREVRKQTRFWRMSCNLIMCPLAMVFDESYHTGVDALIASAVANKETLIMNQSGASAVLDQNITEAKKQELFQQGHAITIPHKFSLKTWFALHAALDNKNQNLLKALVVAKSPHCFYCKKYGILGTLLANLNV